MTSYPLLFSIPAEVVLDYLPVRFDDMFPELVRLRESKIYLPFLQARSLINLPCPAWLPA